MRFGNSNTGGVVGAAGAAGAANAEDEVLIVATNTGNIGGSVVAATNIAAGQIACTVEFQVMKKYPGHCVRLGKSGRGCVAGNHIVPFHPDCF